MITDEAKKIDRASDNAPTVETRAQNNMAQVSDAQSTETASAASTDATGAAANEVAAKATNEVSVSEAVPPVALSKGHRLALSSTTGMGYIVLREGTNPFAIPIASKLTEALIHDAAHKKGERLSQQAVSDAKYRLQSNAERIGAITDIWYRVAPVSGGIEFDLGDKAQTRVRVTAGLVEIVVSGSETVFCRASGAQPMPMPAEVGDVTLLKKYVSLDPIGFMLWLAWVSYTMATPKSASAKYVILVLQGGEGSGKSVLAKLSLRLIDPSQVSVRRLPKNDKDFGVAAQSAQVLAFDNLRFLSHDQADLLCMAATGGHVSSRALYTDGDQSILSLLVAVILNGIPNVVDQPDLAQRTLQLVAQVLLEHLRRSETEMEAELVADLPVIQRGLFDLIARIFEQLPKVKVTRPARMIDFSRWLAAMELVDGVPDGQYQDAYLDTLNQAQLDSVLDNPLAAEVMKFAERLPDGEAWSGTPSALLTDLNQHVDLGTSNSKGWPGNVISLSKRLLPLQTALRSQGVTLELSRAKHRTITISWLEGYARDVCSAATDEEGRGIY